MANEEPMIVQAAGTVTPPPPPCGNPECGWVELDLIHDPDCKEN